MHAISKIYKLIPLYIKKNEKHEQKKMHAVMQNTAQNPSHLIMLFLPLLQIFSIKKAS